MKGIEQERVDREVAERQVEELSIELQEVTDKLNQRTEIVTEQNEKLRKNTLELEQIRVRLVHSDRMATIGKLVSGLADELTEPVSFVSNNISSLSGYVSDLAEIIAKQYSYIDNQKSFIACSKIREIKKLKKKINLDFVLQDSHKILIESVDGIERIEQMLVELADFSTVENTELIEEDINQLLEKALFLACSELRYKVEIVKEYGQLPRVVCDRGGMVQVFLNLLINAAQAIDSKGIVTVRTGMHSSMIWVDIADTGPGISEQDLAEIFDPFFTSKSPGKGAGLGLHLVREVIEAHDGRTNVMSREGQGTTFRLMLPVNNITESIA